MPFVEVSHAFQVLTISFLISPALLKDCYHVHVLEKAIEIQKD